jgi:hypothetical protein
LNNIQLSDTPQRGILTVAFSRAAFNRMTLSTPINTL